MNKILASIVALLPSYFALFCGLNGTTFILVVSTIFGGFLTGLCERDRDLKPILQLGWILHLLGVCIVVAVKNLG